MLFAVDAHAIGRRLTGNEVYIRNMLSGLEALSPQADITAYYSVPEAQALIPQRFATRRVSTNPFLRLGLQLGARLRQDKPDLLHVQYTAPLGCNIPVVASVHDISFLERPEYFPAARALQLKLTVSRTIRGAARVLTPSEFSRAAILRAYRLPEERVAVVPIGVSAAFRPVDRTLAAARVKQTYGYDFPYVLSVGDLIPRKNQMRLIQSFAALLAAEPQLPHHLVLAGKDSWFGERVRRFAARSAAAARIHFTGFVPDEELLYLYNGCDVFAFPSCYEGFGMPILEAMACGRAVACSNAAAMPEVANATALLFDPYVPAEMTRSLRDLLVDAELRARMERLGIQRASQFSWVKTASRTLEIYYDVAGERRRAGAGVRVPAVRS
jgi:glycosyltransferase involved in cell wall biosynthesis